LATTRNLTAGPRLGRVGARRVVHPLGDLVRHDLRVDRGAVLAEVASAFVVADAIRLDPARRADVVVEAEDAAVVRRPLVFDDVARDEEREGLRADQALAGEARQNGVLQLMSTPTNGWQEPGSRIVEREAGTVMVTLGSCVQLRFTW
jgi:hypothetical protein